MDDILPFIKSRRSTRKFKDKPVEKEILIHILEAGQYAPSSCNSQMTHFIVVQNKKILEKLAKLTQQEFSKLKINSNTEKAIANSIIASKYRNYVFHHNAPVLIITANQIESSNNIADCSCALENMMLMANALNLGSCWVNQLRWLNDNPIILQYLSELGMKKSERVYGALAIGYADTEDGLPLRKPLERKGNIVTFI